MARRSKGFNAPFGHLNLPAKPASEVAPETAPKTIAPVQATVARPAADVSDADLFLQAMRGTAPLPAPRQPHRVEPSKRERSLVPPDDALALAELQNLVDGHGEFRVVESEEMHSGLAPGVNFQLLERLQKGHFACHEHIDLHGMAREAAHHEIIRFIKHARRNGERCVLIITGRGKKSPGGVAVLRDALPRWLTRAPLRAHVLAFCNALLVDGGPGAFYVLLRRAGAKPTGGDVA